jgi:hypothetical protein
VLRMAGFPDDAYGTAGGALLPEEWWYQTLKPLCRNQIGIHE